ncbi:hypothetical protein [Kocuria marina]|uniref:hypothetical protein n=1 Tax=Kocuria marina TaxID=223184 RepID=UPI0022E6109E|nr:hypothetical protein [Kocuria marina]
MAATERRRPRSAVLFVMAMFVTGLMANALLRELRDRGIITTPVLVLATVFLLGGFAVYWRFYWVPRASSSEPDRPRIVVAETWHSPYPPREAAARMRDAFTAPAARVTADDTSVHVRTGSDTTYRIRGAGSAKGWDALPLAVDLTAAPSEEGSNITAEARDDLGYYEDQPAPFVEIEVRRRGRELIRRAVVATAGDGQ